jgi:inner membrane protein
METTNTSPFAFLSRFAITFKLIVIGFLAILLLIPSVMIQELIHEREMLKQTAVAEIGGKWAEAQLISGPILTFPMQFEKTENQKTSSYVENLHLLPKDLTVTGTISPEQLKRGIFSAIVYRSDIQITGTFQVPTTFDEAHFVGIKGNKALVNMGLSDLRGVEEVVNLKWGNASFPVSPGSTIPDLQAAGFHVAVPMEKLSAGAEIPFSIQLKLRGSEKMSFLPVGQTTEIKLQSAWPSPKFDGKFLPNDRKLDEKGFEASWKILELNRNFPQRWKDDAFNAQLKGAAFGVELLSPMEDYQKSLRSAKYALLTISLTFLMFFLVEILGKKNIHPFQYLMVGLSICLFYVLLIAISEHSNFNFAYLVAMSAVIITICLYSLPLFKTKKYTFALGSVLLGTFGFIFVTLQMEDYALLMGSLGLFVILAATMYITRNIDWYNIKGSSQAD